MAMTTNLLYIVRKNGANGVNPEYPLLILMRENVEIDSGKYMEG